MRTDVPAVAMKLGRDPWEHGQLGVVRTLGALGVPVHAVVEDDLAPAGRSRFARQRHIWPTTGLEPPEELVDGLRRLGERIGRQPVIYACDDETAVLLAEHADVLASHFRMPPVPSNLPRRVSSKKELAEICRDAGVATPTTYAPTTRAEAMDRAEELGYPFIAKGVEPFVRRARPTVIGTSVVMDRDALRALVQEWPEPFSVLFQELLPHEIGEDWIFQTYADRDGEPTVTFTARKLRTWPAHYGTMSLGETVRNDEVVELGARVVRDLGYRGICDLDFRFDRRDGRYKLLDFNPRLGTGFTLFATTAGVDVVRAMYLDLTGQPVPAGAAVEGRRLIVDNLDRQARRAYRKQAAAATEPAVGGVSRVWRRWDDPLPGILLALRMTLGPLRARLRRRRARAAEAG